jgi:hypothetical protein
MLTTHYTSNPNIVYLPDVKVTENNYATVELIEKMLRTPAKQMVNDAAMIKKLQQAYYENGKYRLAKDEKNNKR